MTTLILSHPACIAHDPGFHHPECSQRLEVVLAELRQNPDFADLAWAEAPAAERDTLLRVHPAAHVDRVLAAVPERGHVNLDGDTILSPDSGTAALRAAGAACAAVDAVMAGSCRNAFCAVRPPGHHAEPERAMGFCLFNNVAVAALHAHVAHGRERVAVIDFDVHHGNGTQAMFADDPRLFYASTHQYPLYPGTGGRQERGQGNIVNAPLPARSGSPEFRHAMTEFVLPELESFMPDMVLVSAGFDAHTADPLGGLFLTDDDFAWVTRKLGDIADRHCQGRLVSVLEGGYDLTALASATAAHVRGLMAA